MAEDPRPALLGAQDLQCAEQAAWNSFRSGDYDTAVFEAFKAVEGAVVPLRTFAAA
jgi:hypothetical protein